MQNVGIAGAITKGPRGGRNLYGSVPWERARGLACEKGEIKRVIKGGRLRLLYFSRKGGSAKVRESVGRNSFLFQLIVLLNCPDKTHHQ